MVSVVASTDSFKGKPHWRRTEQVYAVLDASPPDATYDRLIEYVRVQTGKGCSRKLISKWKKTIISRDKVCLVCSTVPSKPIANHDDEPPTGINKSASLFVIPSQPIKTTFKTTLENKQAQAEKSQNTQFILDYENEQESISADVLEPKFDSPENLTEKAEPIQNTQSPILHLKSKIKHTWSYVAATTIVLGIAGCTWFFSKDNSQPVIAQPTSIQNEQPSIQNPKSKIQNGLPRTIKIDLTLSHPQDLKVKPGDEVTQGTILSDPAGIREAVRTLERQRLLSQKKQLQLSLKKLDLPIPPITNPEPLSKLGKLPPVSYQQEEANIALKQQELDQAEKAIANQQEKIRQLSELLTTTQGKDFNNNLRETEIQSQVKFSQLPTNNSNVALQGNSSNKEILNNPKQANTSLKQNSKLPTVEITSNTIANLKPTANNQNLKIIIEHEQAILSQLKAARDKAQLQLDIAKSKLITAKEERAHAQYQRYVEENRRAIALQQQQIELERQRSIRAGQIQEREYSKAQIEAKIQEIDNAINNLSTVKAPYPGKIKKVKWTGQDNHHLTVQLTLDVDDGSEKPTVISQQ